MLSFLFTDDIRDMYSTTLFITIHATSSRCRKIKVEVIGMLSRIFWRRWRCPLLMRWDSFWLVSWIALNTGANFWNDQRLLHATRFPESWDDVPSWARVGGGLWRGGGCDGSDCGKRKVKGMRTEEEKEFESGKSVDTGGGGTYEPQWCTGLL